MSDKAKIAIIKGIIENYYECCYDNDACAATVDAIFTIVSFGENED